VVPPYLLQRIHHSIWKQRMENHARQSQLYKKVIKLTLQILSWSKCCTLFLN
jgi:hypothetical protein